jgi:hypothetical protein
MWDLRNTFRNGGKKCFMHLIVNQIAGKVHVFLIKEYPHFWILHQHHSINKVTYYKLTTEMARYLVMVNARKDTNCFVSAYNDSHCTKGLLMIDPSCPVSGFIRRRKAAQYNTNILRQPQSQYLPMVFATQE